MVKKESKILRYTVVEWIVLLGVIVVLITSFLFGFNLLFKEWFNSLLDMFGNKTIALLILHALSAIAVGFVYYTLMKFSHRKFKESFKVWFQLTIICSLIILYVGTMAIYTVVGTPNLDSVLRDKNAQDNVVGELDCTDESRQFMQGNRIECNILKPNFVSFNSTITLTNEDGSKAEFSRDNEIWFNALEKTKKVYFEINGIDKNGEYFNLHVSRNFEFTTPDQVIENNNKRMAYFIALLGVILFSVPSFVLNLRKLYRDEK